MKKMKLSNYRCSLLVILATFLPGILFGQSDGKYGTTMNLSYGAGARAMGLGRAYVAVANDPTAIFWNPAGLELVPRTSLTLFHNQLFRNIFPPLYRLVRSPSQLTINAVKRTCLVGYQI